MRTVLLSGGYGVGKSTIVEEIAEVLDEAKVRFAAIDLDWLAWASIGDGGRSAELAMLLTNLVSVVGNYRQAGVQYLVLAWAVRDREELAALRTAIETPLRVVELTLPLDDVARRLEHAPTTGRHQYLEVARQWMREGLGTGLAEHTVPNNGPPREAALGILRWLGWLPD